MWPLYTAMVLAPIIAIVAWWVVSMDRVDDEALAKVAAARGWVASPHRDEREEGVALRPGDGSWTLLVTRRTSKSTEGTSRSGGLRTLWTAAIKSPSGVLAVRAGPPPVGPLAPPPSMLAPLLARAIEEMTGAPAGDVGSLSTLARIETGDPRLDGAHMVFANEPAFADWLATAAQRDAVLAATATGAAVIVSPTGLRLAIAGKALADGAQIDAIVKAGTALRRVWGG